MILGCLIFHHGNEIFLDGIVLFDRSLAAKNMNIPKYVLPAFFCATLFACSESDRSTTPYPYTELAMQPGMKIEATNKNGTVSIEYLAPLERRYKWNGYDEKRTLIPRKERFNGYLGAYDPAISYSWEIFSIRIVAQDSQVHFKNADDLRKWLYQSSDVMDWVYTDTGLVVGFEKIPSSRQVSIDVFQIYLNGNKPEKLEGSRPENIKIK